MSSADSSAPDQPGQPQPPAPDAVGRGVLGDGDTEPLTLFVLSGPSLGANAIRGGGDTRWFDLRAVVNLDALGEPQDDRQRIEMSFEDGDLLVALLPETFLNKMVDRLQELLASGEMSDSSGGIPSDSMAPPPPIPAVATAAVPPPAPAFEATGHSASGAPMDRSVVENAPMPGDGEPMVPTTGESGQDQLVLEHVVYHGGYPGENKRRKHCTLVMDHTGVDLSGSHGLDFKIAWESVNSVEVQNPDEAKFRLNIKAKRNSTSLVFACADDVMVVVEARNVPTVPMRGALQDLLAPHGISVA